MNTISTYHEEKNERKALNPLYHRARFLSISFSISILLITSLFSYSTTNNSPFVPEMEDVDEGIFVEILQPNTILVEPKENRPAPKQKEVFRADADIIVTKEEEKKNNVSLIPLEVEAENPDAKTIIDMSQKNPAPPLPPEKNTEAEIPRRFVEQMPFFNACEDIEPRKSRETCAKDALLAYIYKKVKYPILAKEVGIEGTCVFEFVVNSQGKVENIKTLVDIGGGCGEEGLRAIRSMNDLDTPWIAGKQNGKAVPVLFTLPISFKLQ